MRDIKFRGKGDKKYNDGMWYFGVPIRCYGGDWQICTDNSKRTVIPETIGQDTGLKDRNGTKIFEGDIVEITFHSDTKYQYLIWFNKEMSCWEAIETKDIRFNGNDYYGNNVEYSDFCFMLQDPYGDVESVKIIGNVHDTPELLRGDNNA